MKQSAVSVSRPVRSFRMPRRRLAWGGAILGTVAALGVLAWFGLSAYATAKVRARLESAGGARGLALAAEDVTLRWGGVRISGVTIDTPGASPEGAAVLGSVREIEVDVSWSGSPRAVRIHGGQLTVRGELDELRERFARRSDGAPSEPSTASGLTVDVADLDLAYRSRLVDLLASGAGVHTLADGTRVLSAQHTRIRFTDSERGGELEATTVSVELGEGTRIRGARIDELAITRAPAPPAPAAITPPVHAPDAQNAPDAPWALPWPNPSGWRATLLALGERVSEHLTEDAVLRVAGLRFDLGRELRFGPTPFRVQRRPDALVAELAPEEGQQAGGTPLAFHVDVPLGPGHGDPSATLEGGPVPLSLLGFREGQLFLHQTSAATLRGRGKVVLGEPLRVDLTVDVEHVGVDHSRLALTPVDDVSFGLDLRGSISGTRVLAIEEAKLRLGELGVQVRGSLAQLPEGDALVGHGSLDVAHVSCEDLHQAVPKALAPHLADFRFGGDFAFSAVVELDTRRLDDMVLDLRQMGTCRALQTPEWASRRHFDGEFTHTVYDADGKPRDETTGPGTDKYTRIDRISPFMPVAVLTSEDGSFFHHHGWSKTAIRRALIANLKAGRFRQGASTISMQLSKNLFLSRNKTLSRKLEELVLTDYLEQTFDKNEMMELYLNVIEFGPDIYGITQAARFYYGREPEELQLAECMFLASLLPSPVKRSRQREKKELVGASRSMVDFLIRAAEKTGKISRAEMEEGLAQPIVFLHGDRPPPRAPVHGTRFDGDAPEEEMLQPGP